MNIEQQDRLLKVKEVVQIVSASQSTIFRWVKQQIFPAPVKIGSGTFWRNSEIQEFISGQSHQIEA